MQAKSLFLALSAVLLLACPGAARQWTSSDGVHQIEAELVGLDSQRVRLKKKDGGEIVVVPLEQLGEADQKWIAEIVRRQKAAQGVLEKKGFRVTTDGLQVPEELELKNGLRELPQLKKTLLDFGRRLETAQKQVDDNQDAINKLVEANGQLSAQLAMIGVTQVTLNNKLVGALQANKAQLILTQQRGTKLEEQLKTARAEAYQARKTYFEAVMKLRTLIVGIVAKYEDSAKDPEIVKAVAGLNEVIPGVYVLGESRTLASSIRQLDKLEEQIYSESIPLRSEGGRMYVSVAINGQHAQEMVVDAGASISTLPLGFANQCGIQVSDSDPTVVLAFGDGNKIPGKLVTLGSLSVGRFTAKDVKCAVLGIEAINAQPILGKTFLEKFQYEINTQKGILTLIQVAADDKAPTGT